MIKRHYTEQVRYCDTGFMLVVLLNIIAVSNLHASSSLGESSRPALPLDNCHCFYNPETRSPHDVSMGLYIQAGDIQNLQVDLNYYLSERFFMVGTYHLSRQDYQSKYITTPCIECDINFHGVFWGIGYELYYCWNRHNGAYINASLKHGVETTINATLFQEHESLSIFNQALIPGIQAGWIHKKMAFSIGVNYTHWIYHTMTSDREPLYDAVHNTRISWEEDLFVGREGVGFLLGLKYFIRR